MRKLFPILIILVAGFTACNQSTTSEAGEASAEELADTAEKLVESRESRNIEDLTLEGTPEQIRSSQNPDLTEKPANIDLEKIESDKANKSNSSKSSASTSEEGLVVENNIKVRENQDPPINPVEEGGGTTGAMKPIEPLGFTDASLDYIVPMYNYQSNAEVVITYYVPELEGNYDNIKQELMAERDRLASEVPNLVQYELICFDSKANTPNVTNNDDEAEESEYDQHRVCALDNIEGFPVFRYKGTNTTGGSDFRWMFAQQYDLGTEQWKEYN